MIHTIEIENFRGIRTGRLEGLAPLTILTGPNASGKSAVLDALLVGASPLPVEQAVGRAVNRHPGTFDGARWLIRATGSEARVSVETSSAPVDKEKAWSRRFRWEETLTKPLLEAKLLEKGSTKPFSTLWLREDVGTSMLSQGLMAFGSDNQFVVEKYLRSYSSIPEMRLADPGLPEPLETVFSDAAKEKRLKPVESILKTLVAGAEGLHILVERNGKPNLYIEGAEGSIPIGLAGDGIQAFLQLALEIAVVSEGIALIEEPEVYQHPKALWQTAKVILANVRRGVQVVMTTHSQELIDALISEAEGDDLDRMATFSLALDDGELLSKRRTGEAIEFSRMTAGMDLR